MQSWSPLRAGWHLLAIQNCSGLFYQGRLLKHRQRADTRTFVYEQALLLAIAIVIASSSWSMPVMVEPGVSIALAEQRAKVLTNIRYQLDLSIEGDNKTPILGKGRNSF